MSFETVIYEKKDKVAWISLNRQEVFNAQNAVLIREVVEALEQAKADDDVWVIAITGAGKAFSAGADIGMIADWTSLRVMTGWKVQKKPYDFARQIPKPVIAVVNGVALGGGCELAMGCDIIVASDKARFALPEVGVGIIPGGGGTQMLPRLVGEKKAKELIFTCDQISADEALRLGLVNHVVPHENLMETAEELIGKLLTKSPAMLAMAKMAVNAALEMPLSAGMASEADLLAACFATEDQKEGAKAFLEKRAPDYKGQ